MQPQLLRIPHPLQHGEHPGRSGSPGWIAAQFLRVWSDRLPPGASVQAINNLSVGPGLFPLDLAGESQGNYTVGPAMLKDLAALDFSLPADSPLRGRGVDPQSALGADLSPKAEFALPVGTWPLPLPPAWTPGAFQR